MKSREINDLKQKQPAELLKLVEDSNEKLRNMKFDLAAGKVKNAGEIRELRKLIARAHTFIKQHGKAK